MLEKKIYSEVVYSYHCPNLFKCIYFPADCSLAILSSESNSSSGLVAVANINSDPMSITHLVLRDKESPERFHFSNETYLVLNNAFCSISKLEVFRSWNQTFEINHNGFSLSGHATVEVHIIHY